MLQKTNNNTFFNALRYKLYNKTLSRFKIHNLKGSIMYIKVFLSVDAKIYKIIVMHFNLTLMINKYVIFGHRTYLNDPPLSDLSILKRKYISIYRYYLFLLCVTNL